MDLSESRAVIVGGAGGIGTAMVERLLAEGARVAVVDQCQHGLDQMAERIPAASDRLALHRADVTAADYSPALASALDSLGEVDLMIYAAGVLIDGVIVGLGPGGMASYDPDSWNHQVAVNLTGAFITAQVAAERMIRARTRGCLVFFSSVSREGRPGQGCYGATKAGVAALATSMARELAPYRIRAFSVAPGLTETAMAMSVPDARREEFSESVLARRMATADEVAHLTLEAIRNDYVCASVLEVHGGYIGY